MKNSSLYSKMLDVNILRNLPEDQKIDFLDQCAVRTYDETVTVMSQGEMFDGMLLIAKGSMEISFINPNGHQAIISHVGVGAIVGTIEAVAQKPCAAMDVSRFSAAPYSHLSGHSFEIQGAFPT